MKMKLFFASIGFVYSLFFSIAQAQQYPECPENVTSRSRKDFFCPRVEGSYFPSCCPLVFKTSPISCFYYTKSSVPTKTLSSALSCVDGENVRVPCCDYGSLPCNTGVVEAPYIQRLFKGQGDKCCYEDCPSAEYWSSTRGPTYGVTVNHKKYGRTRPPQICADVAAQNPSSCGEVTASCGSFSACPVVPAPQPPAPNPPAPNPPAPNPPAPNPPAPNPPAPNPPNPPPRPNPPSPPTVELPD